MSSKSEALKQKFEEKEAQLFELSCKLKSERVESQFFEEQVRQSKKIADGKPYILQCAYGGNMFAFLTRLWRSPCAFTDLPRSAAEAAKHYAAHDRDGEQRLF